jgi:hypothetical protein
LPAIAPTLPIATAMSSVRTSDKLQPYFPLAGQAKDGYSNAEEATATCYCGAVQLAFPVEGPGLISTFVCNCTDCRKITASMFASNFTIKDRYVAFSFFSFPLLFCSISMMLSNPKNIEKGNNQSNMLQPPSSPARARKSLRLQSSRDNSFRPFHGKLFLQNMRYAHVPCRRRLSWLFHFTLGYGG